MKPEDLDRVESRFRELVGESDPFHGPRVDGNTLLSAALYVLTFYDVQLDWDNERALADKQTVQRVKKRWSELTGLPLDTGLPKPYAATFPWNNSGVTSALRDARELREERKQ